MNQRQALYVLAHVSGIVSAQVGKSENGRTLVAVFGDGLGHTTEVRVSHLGGDWGRTVTLLVILMNQWIFNRSFDYQVATKRAVAP